MSCASPASVSVSTALCAPLSSRGPEFFAAISELLSRGFAYDDVVAALDRNESKEAAALYLFKAAAIKKIQHNNANGVDAAAAPAAAPAPTPGSDTVTEAAVPRVQPLTDGHTETAQQDSSMETVPSATAAEQSSSSSPPAASPSQSEQLLQTMQAQIARMQKQMDEDLVYRQKLEHQLLEPAAGKQPSSIHGSAAGPAKVAPTPWSSVIVCAGGLNQYSVGSPSGCTVMCLEAALQLLAGMALTAELLASILVAGSCYTSEFHTGISELLPVVSRYATLRIADETQVPVNRLPQLIQQLVTLAAVEVHGPVAVMLTKPPESVLLFFSPRPGVPTPFVLFDSHKRQWHDGAAFLTFASATTLQTYIQRFLFPSDAHSEHMSMQEQMYYLYDACFLAPLPGVHITPDEVLLSPPQQIMLRQQLITVGQQRLRAEAAQQERQAKHAAAAAQRQRPAPALKPHHGAGSASSSAASSLTSAPPGGHGFWPQGQGRAMPHLHRNSSANSNGSDADSSSSSSGSSSSGVGALAKHVWKRVTSPFKAISPHSDNKDRLDRRSMHYGNPPASAAQWDSAVRAFMEKFVPTEGVLGAHFVPMWRTFHGYPLQYTAVGTENLKGFVQHFPHIMRITPESNRMRIVLVGGGGSGATGKKKFSGSASSHTANDASSHSSPNANSSARVPAPALLSDDNGEDSSEALALRLAAEDQKLLDAQTKTAAAAEKDKSAKSKQNQGLLFDVQQFALDRIAAERMQAQMDREDAAEEALRVQHEAEEAATAAIVAELQKAEESFQRDAELAKSLQMDTFDCPYCLETVSMEAVFTPRCCSSKICRNCTRDNILAQLDDAKMPSCMCKERMIEGELRQFLTEDEFNRYLAMSLDNCANNANANNTSGEYWLSCATADCKIRVIGDQQTLQWRCDTCLVQWCAKCRTPWHDGQTCEQFKLTAAYAKDRADVIANIGNLPLCPCPRDGCAAPVEKTGGCNAMNCKCGCGFCFLCKRDFGADAHPHFNDRADPCFGRCFDGLGY